MDTQPSRITLSVEEHRSLVVGGVIDAHTADDLQAAIDALGTNGDIDLGMAAVDFIDSSGLRAIVASHHSLDKAGHKLVLRGISDAVDRLIEITGLRDHLHLA